MRAVRVSEDFVSLGEFKTTSSAWLRRAEKTGAPIVVTENGKPAAVLLSPEAFDELSERARLMAAISEGLADVEAGRTVAHAAVKRRLLPKPAKKR